MDNTTDDVTRQMMVSRLASLHDTYPELRSSSEFMSLCRPELLAEGRLVLEKSNGNGHYFEEERLRQSVSPEGIAKMWAETEARLARGIPPVSEEFYRNMSPERKLGLIKMSESGGHAEALAKVVYWENRQQTDPHSEPEPPTVTWPQYE